jgi:hypothetical protein
LSAAIVQLVPVHEDDLAKLAPMQRRIIGGIMAPRATTSDASALSMPRRY